ncbi:MULTISPECIES: relaxase/mobilization nuclease domain-containing protein [Niastella]|uniref:Relaxase/mobilization nuclease domain-containing protein n=1 Tax=Niastella soli TaxID=2821487 RepID=A0ABS3YNT1_9BACT|nr:relaxase/mobilization nuclease domain-containing protein [Niastella soli]
MEDKIGLSENQKVLKALKDQLQHKDRAEVLEFNKCFGDLGELTSQFLDVAKLSKRVEKPVFHFSLRPAPGDKVSREQLIEMGKECAKQFGVADNQYLIILHKDTAEPHIHIVANRVGLDGKVAKDNHSYRRMDSLCRQLEKQFQLREVLSARRFLSEELRNLPRLDNRKEKLKTDIRNTLVQVKTLQQLEEKMKSLGYKVLIGRGISFIDDKKVKIKGSEVGFSLSKIERILDLKQELAIKQEKQQQREIAIQRDIDKAYTPVQKLLIKTAHSSRKEDFEASELVKQLDNLLGDLLKPEYVDQSVNPELLKEAKRKRKRQRPRL